MADIKIQVPVTFQGMVTVSVPETVPEARRLPLAEYKALSNIVAELTDEGELDAFESYLELCGLDEDLAGSEWDSCKAEGVGGTWVSEHYE